MTKATKGLRRAGVATIASLALAASGLVAAHTASAWDAASVIHVAAAGETTVHVGSNQAGGDITLTLDKKWHVGDTIKLTVDRGANCTTPSNKIGFDAVPAWAAELPAGAHRDSTKPTVTIALSSSAGACATTGVKDIATLTFTNSGTNAATDATGPVLKLTGWKYVIGDYVSGDVTLALTAAGTGAASFTSGSPAAPATRVSNARVIHTKVAVSSVASTTPGGVVAIGTVTAGDYIKGAIHGESLQFTLANATWDTPGTLTGGGLTFGPGVKSAGDAVLTFTGTGTLADAVNTFKLTGAKVRATGAGPVRLGVADIDDNVVGERINIAAAANVGRVGGSDRFATASMLWPAGRTTAVIVNGTKAPDALSANFLASSLQEDAGLLLTHQNSLPGITKSTLIGKGVTKVYIIGDTKSVSKAVEDEIAAIPVAGGGTIAVERIAGADRYQTNEQVNLYRGIGTVLGGTAIVTTGEKFPDALAAGPVAYAHGYPIVLTTGARLSESARSTFLNNPSITSIIILGDTNSVSAAVETELNSIRGDLKVRHRFAGADRTETARMVATWFTTSGTAFPETGNYAAVSGLGWGSITVWLARGDDFADALAAASKGQAILLTVNPSVLGGGAQAFIKKNAVTVTTINPLGLTQSVNASVVNQAIAALAG